MAPIPVDAFAVGVSRLRSLACLGSARRFHTPGSSNGSGTSAWKLPTKPVTRILTALSPSSCCPPKKSPIRSANAGSFRKLSPDRRNPQASRYPIHGERFLSDIGNPACRGHGPAPKAAWRLPRAHRGAFKPHNPLTHIANTCAICVT